MTREQAHEEAMETAVGFKPGNPGATGPAAQMRYEERERCIKAYLAAMRERGFKMLPRKVTPEMLEPLTSLDAQYGHAEQRYTAAWDAYKGDETG